MNKIGTKIIDTERCILRRIVPDDGRRIMNRVHIFIG